jgi:hypothetical protein
MDGTNMLSRNAGFNRKEEEFIARRSLFRIVHARGAIPNKMEEDVEREKKQLLRRCLRRPATTIDQMGRSKKTSPSKICAENGLA